MPPAALPQYRPVTSLPLTSSSPVIRESGHHALADVPPGEIGSAEALTAPLASPAPPSA